MKLCKISSVRVAIRKLNYSQVVCITCISINKLSFFGKQGERGTERVETKKRGRKKWKMRRGREGKKVEKH